MIALAFITTVLACIIEYTRFQTDEEHVLPSLTILTIILPILLGICATCLAAFSPISKSAMLTLVHARLVQEMYKYRCRIGNYRARTGLGSAHRVAFSNKLKSMWDDIMNSEVMKGSLDIDMKIHTSRFSTSPLGDNGYNSTELLNNSSLTSGIGQKYREVIPLPTHKTNAIFELQPLTSEQYIIERLETTLLKFKHDIPSLSRQIRLLQVGTIAASSAGALLASYNLQLWMPVLLSFVTVLDSVFEYNKMPLKQRCSNIAYSKLKQVIFWWSGLTLIQQRMPQNKYRLVTTIEGILYDQISVMVEGDLESKDDVNFADVNNNTMNHEGMEESASVSANLVPSGGGTNGGNGNNGLSNSNGNNRNTNNGNSGGGSMAIKRNGGFKSGINGGNNIW